MSLIYIPDILYLGNDYWIKARLKDLYIKLLRIPTRLSFIIKLFNLLIHSFLVFTLSL
jgi:hypothetical protein